MTFARVVVCHARVIHMKLLSTNSSVLNSKHCGSSKIKVMKSEHTLLSKQDISKLYKARALINAHCYKSLCVLLMVICAKEDVPILVIVFTVCDDACLLLMVFYN